MNAPKICCIAAFISVLILSSCKDNGGISPVQPPEEEQAVLNFKLRKLNVAAFLSITDPGMPADMDESKIQEYFGDRVASFVPIEITVKADSTVFVKQGGLEEKFRTKWEEENKLYVYNDHDKSWTLLGEKTEGTFVLKVGFFSKTVQGASRSSTLLGQEYALDSYDGLISDQEASNLVWLSIDLFYN